MRRAPVVLLAAATAAAAPLANAFTVVNSGTTAASPNPAHLGTAFEFGLPHDTRIRVGVFDAGGRRVRTLWAGAATSGRHSLRWDGRDDAHRVVPSGPYFYRLTVEGRILNGRVLVTH